MVKRFRKWGTVLNSSVAAVGFSRRTKEGRDEAVTRWLLSKGVVSFGVRLDSVPLAMCF